MPPEEELKQVQEEKLENENADWPTEQEVPQPTQWDFGVALRWMIDWHKVCNKIWNGLSKQKMYVALQRPDENSKMNMPYLYMVVSKKVEGSDDFEPAIMRPWTPSMLDLLSDTWEVVD